MNRFRSFSRLAYLAFLSALGGLFRAIPTAPAISREIIPASRRREVPTGGGIVFGMRQPVHFQKMSPQRWSNRGGLSGRARRRGKVSHRKAAAR